jgi:hypothetical protein
MLPFRSWTNRWHKSCSVRVGWAIGWMIGFRVEPSRLGIHPNSLSWFDKLCCGATHFEELNT